MQYHDKNEHKKDFLNIKCTYEDSVHILGNMLFFIRVLRVASVKGSTEHRGDYMQRHMCLYMLR